MLRGGHALYPTATAATVRVPDGKGGDPIVSDGPYAETKEALTGYFLLECADLDEALAVAAQFPAAWYGRSRSASSSPPLRPDQRTAGTAASTPC